MQIRDRIKEFRRVRAGQLKPNPRNWRTHPEGQRDSLRGVLAEIGYASALLVRELPDGGLELIDGHLRAETTPDMEVPVLILDVDESEAAKLLATFDPLSGMAGVNGEILTQLLRDVDTQNAALKSMLDGLARRAGIELNVGEESPLGDVLLAEMFQVVVECPDESAQRAVFERMTAEGFKCRVLSL